MRVATRHPQKLSIDMQREAVAHALELHYAHICTSSVAERHACADQRAGSPQKRPRTLHVEGVLNQQIVDQGCIAPEAGGRLKPAAQKRSAPRRMMGL